MKLTDNDSGLDAESVAPEQIRAQLSKVLASRTFVQASRASRFLEFVADAALKGESDAVKETTVGVAVFDRDPGYDPKTDPVVRNAARRLRDLLDRYYLDQGRRDLIRFSLPKGGYTLQVEVVSPVAAAPEPTPELPPTRNNRATVMAVCVVLACAALYVFRSSKDDAQPRFDVTPVTAGLGESFQPAFAPNSRDLAYVWGDPNHKDANYDIYVKTGTGTPVRLTDDPAHDLHPAWSPAGDKIAFVRASRSSMDVYIKAVAPGEREKKVASISGLFYGSWQPQAPEILGSPGPAWTPDGASILITGSSEGGQCCGLFEVAADGSSRHQLTSPGNGAHDFYPSVSPDGRFVAFARYKSHSTASLHLLDRHSKETRQLTVDYSDVRGLAWTPDGRAIVFSSNRGGAYGLWLLPLSTGVARVVAAPGRNAREPAVSASGELVFVDVNDQLDLVRTDLPQAQGAAFAPSSRRTHSPRYSPDGKRVAFLSDRSGTLEIWVAASDGTGARQVTKLGGPYVGSPHWSPDGNALVFDSRVDGHSAVFVVPAQGGEARRLMVNSFEEKRASWANDGKWIYFSSNRTGEARIWKVSVDGKQVRQVSDRLAFESAESVHGHYLYFSDRHLGIWRVPTSGGKSEALPGLETTRADMDWVVSDKGITYVDDLGARDEVRFYDFDQRRSRKMASFARALASAVPCFAISPDLRQMIYAQAGPRQSDLVSVRGWYRE